MRCYFTTPIYYATDPPHLGHAYTTVVTEALTQHRRMRGDVARFLTGTDEHGQKLERVAGERGRSPKQFADEICETYRAAWRRLGIHNDDFIRTTDPDHEAVVADLWRRMERTGDIYLGHYEGWYCVACEQYYTEKELGEGHACPVHQKPVEKVKEESYFFRLSAYQSRLQEFYDHVLSSTGRPFVEPQIRMNEVRTFVDAGLEDFSVSRTTFSWGVPVPDRPGHVVYVWIDALTNYYSASLRSDEARAFWPARDAGWTGGRHEDGAVRIVHVMGKEITRFHAVYWPAVLMSAGLRLPSKILAHGWWTVDGEKMSKTRGNVVDPVRLADDLDAAAGAPVGSDAFRYFVLREVPLGADGDFSHQALLGRYNAELANDLGNLLNRTLGMATRYFAGRVEPSSEDELKASTLAAGQAFGEAMDAWQPSRALDALWDLVRRVNTFIERRAPWKQDEAGRRQTLWSALEACRHIACLVSPVLPERSREMLRQLGTAEPTWPAWDEARTFVVEPGQPVFPRLDEDKRGALLDRWMPKPAAAPPAAAATTEAAPSSPVAPFKPAIAYDDFARLDLRVARIAAAEKVAKKDKLLKLTIDLGSETRTVVAGIAKAFAPEALVGRKVVFVANLQPAKIGGIVSEGMVLAAGDAEILALSTVDADCPPGTTVR